MIQLPIRGTAACIAYAREKGWLTSEPVGHATKPAKYTLSESYTSHKMLSILSCGQRIQEHGRQLSLAQSKHFSEQAYINRSTALVRKNIKMGNPAFFTKHRIPMYNHIDSDGDYIVTSHTNIVKIWKFTISDTMSCQITIGNVNDTQCQIIDLFIKNNTLLYSKKITKIHGNSDGIVIQKFMVVNIQSDKEFELHQAVEKLFKDPSRPIGLRANEIIILQDRVAVIENPMITWDTFEFKFVLHTWKKTGEFIESIDMHIPKLSNSYYTINSIYHNDKYVIISPYTYKKLFIYNIHNKITLSIDLPCLANKISSTHFFDGQYLLCGLSNPYSFNSNSIVKPDPYNGFSLDLKTGAIIRYYHHIDTNFSIPNKKYFSTTITVDKIITVNNYLYSLYALHTDNKNSKKLSVTDLSNNSIRWIDQNAVNLINFKIDGPLLLGLYGLSTISSFILKIWDRQSLKLLNQFPLSQNSHLAFKAGKICLISPRVTAFQFIFDTSKTQEIIQIDYATTREQKEEDHLPLPENSGWLEQHN